MIGESLTRDKKNHKKIGHQMWKTPFTPIHQEREAKKEKKQAAHKLLIMPRSGFSFLFVPQLCSRSADVPLVFLSSLLDRETHDSSLVFPSSRDRQSWALRSSFLETLSSRKFSVFY